MSSSGSIFKAAKKTVINRMVVKKFGIPVASLRETIVKAVGLPVGRPAGLSRGTRDRPHNNSGTGKRALLSPP